MIALTCREEIGRVGRGRFEDPRENVTRVGRVEFGERHDTWINDAQHYTAADRRPTNQVARGNLSSTGKSPDTRDNNPLEDVGRVGTRMLRRNCS